MIHREGINLSILVFIILLVINIPLFLLAGPSPAAWTLLILSLVFIGFVLRFFRVPKRTATLDPATVYAPADGKIVAVEETTEDEYLGDRRMQVSVFMSVWDVHINWFPVGGRVSYYRYHPGRYLVAWHPKSSDLNERNTVVVKMENGKEILIRQIAGAVARRIISYAEENRQVSPGEELGFIRFGSRVDVFLPPGSEILVRPKQKVRGSSTPLAILK